MDITDIETNIQSALDTAGLNNVLVQQHFTASHDDTSRIYFDRSKDPPRLDYSVVTVKRTGSERFASNQVLELGRIDVEVYLAINEADNSEATMRQNVDTVTDTLDSQLTITSEVDRTFPPVATGLTQTNVKGFKCFKAIVSQSFEVMKTVTYS